MDFQQLIHRLEVAGGLRYFRVALGILAFLILVLGYNWRAYKNFASAEAMDSAQLARNIAQGRGYTTLFIRPLSIYLLTRQALENGETATPGQPSDLGHLRTPHPDLANPPAYPIVLAGLMKILPFRFEVDLTRAFWSAPHPKSDTRMFVRHQPDFIISMFNELLFFIVVVAMFFLARRLFDPGVAWVTGLLLLGNQLLWRFSVSGLSTMMLLVLFTGLVWCLTLYESECRTPKWGARGQLLLAGAAGLLTGLGALTRYSFLWVIAPVVLCLVLFTQQRRALAGLVAFLVFSAVLGPWIARNYSVSGTPFGTASYTMREDTAMFPEHQLQRSLEPNLTQNFLGRGELIRDFWQKLVVNFRHLLEDDLPKLGGSWITAFFLVGLLIGFHNPAVRRLRYFLLASLICLALVQALGRTQLTDDSPEVNSENLLVLIVPVVLMFGVSLFFLLLDQVHLPFPEARYIAMGVFTIVGCLQMILTFLPPKTNPVAFPPYYPPHIRTVATWTKESELTMSDVPWAMAWYGQRQSVWLTLNAQSEFFAINDYQKPICLLFLTPNTMDSRFLTQWIMAGELSWGSFISSTLLQRELPPNFPLRKSPKGFLPQELVLTDWERWLKTGSGAPVSP